MDAYKKALLARGLNKSDLEIAGAFGILSERLVEWGVTDVDDAVEEADKIAKENLPNVELYPDALFVLESLHRNGHKLALITSSLHENVAHLLESHNIRQFFDAIIAADDTKNHKPHPEPLEKALALLGGSKEAAVMIGDSDKDLGAAANAGIDSILFYPEEHSKFYDPESLKSYSPTYIVNNFRDVLGIVA
jgi:pyrophosphatase PpaX